MSWTLKCVRNILLLSCVLSGMFPVVTSEEFIIEARVFMDSLGYEKYQRISHNKGKNFLLKEMKSIFLEVSELLQSLKEYQIDIRIQLKELVVLDHTMIPVDRRNRVDNPVAMKAFQKWLNSNETKQYRDYDLAILYTGADFYYTKGYSYDGSICFPGWSMNIVSYQGTYQDVLQTVHEVGHNIGGHHDGGRHAPDCYGSMEYIMSSTYFYRPPSINHFHFSTCSAESIKATLGGLYRRGVDCLTDAWPSDHHSVSRYGDLLSPDESCRRKFGPESYVARVAFPSYGNDACVKLPCVTYATDITSIYSYIPTPQGVPCGRKKICNQGLCKRSSDASAEYTKDSCPFGDQPTVRKNDTCSSLAPNQCIWQTSCCESCTTTDPAKDLTADKVCQYLVGPFSTLARNAYGSYGDSLCSHLACVTSEDSPDNDWSYFTAPDGLACGSGKRCEKGKCIPKSDGDQTISDSCPYGDQPSLGNMSPNSCAGLDRINDCYFMEKLCCDTCKGY